MMARQAFRCSILHCLDDPGPQADNSAFEYFDDGVLLINDGYVERVGPAETLLADAGDGVEVVDHRGKLIVPGFIDCHVHYPQVEIIASYGEQLLDWLDRYAFPAEARFSDEAYAAEVAEFFVDELLKNGTTTAMVFATVHPQSVDALFDAAARRNVRLIAGKVLMDRNCPENLRDTAESGYQDSKALLLRWHGKGRLSYAITPRFAVTSSEDQLRSAGKLGREFPEAYVHTHLAENLDEVSRVARQFPWSKSYLDVYDQFGLVRERSVFAHCLHLDARDRQALAANSAAIAFCPSSNLFLGSGLFDLDGAAGAGIAVGVGSDVGGGTSLNTFRTLHDAYKMLQFDQQFLPALRGLYLATLGGARALSLDHCLGNFEAGKEADFVLLDDTSTSMTRLRAAHARDVAERFFALMMLGDDRAVAQTYVMGEAVS
ncbi:MAG: guanine deaminase [Gammaproteobacteria bacterium]|nr:guanine deaminase [Gammaproteobacteria bacterium]